MAIFKNLKMNLLKIIQGKNKNMSEQQIKEIKIPVQRTVILNSVDRFYHDVVITYKEPSYYVCSLVNERTSGTWYELLPTTIIMPYKTEQEADTVYDGIIGIMDYQKTQPAYKNIRKWVANDINEFRQNITKMKYTIVR